MSSQMLIRFWHSAIRLVPRPRRSPRPGGRGSRRRRSLTGVAAGGGELAAGGLQVIPGGLQGGPGLPGEPGHLAEAFLDVVFDAGHVARKCRSSECRPVHPHPAV